MRTLKYLVLLIIFSFVLLLCIGVLFTLALPLSAAIAHDASANSGDEEGVTPWTASLAATGSSANTTVIMTVMWWSNNNTVTIGTPTYGGSNMTLSTKTLVNGSGSPASDYYCSIYYLVNPPTGTQTGSVSFSSGSYGEMGLTDFTGTNTASPVDNTAATAWSSGTSGTSMTTNITTNYADSALVDCFGIGGNATSILNSQTTEWTNSSRPSGSSRKTTTTAGSYSMSWSWTGSYGSGDGVIAIRELPVVAPTIYPVFSQFVSWW
jgi:hypothetical protein